MSIEGRVLQIQNFSVNDGNGIRSTVFLAGCPLRCKWCSNPEGFDAKPKTAWYKATCVGCGKCVEACPLGIGIDLNLPENRAKCTGCGKCADVCPNHSRKRMVETMTSDEVVEKIKPFIQFFRQSGGGVTFSGGEATVQKDFLRETVKKLYDLGVDIAIETSGYFDFDETEDILKMMETVFIDIKHMNSDKHVEFTSVENKKILENIGKLSKINTEVVVRIPVIEGVNADAGNIKETAEFVHRTLPKAKIELLPYHRYGESKYEALGMEYPSESFGTPEEDKIEVLKKAVEEKGVLTIEYK